MNRHWQLVQTLESNLQCIAAFKGRVEWVITNIHRADDVSGTDWSASDALIKEKAAALLEKGWVRYHTTTMREWNPSIAKNIGKFCAIGKFLINLDIDNTISVADTVRLLKLDLDHTIYYGFDGTWGSGTSGMVGVPRAVFFAVGGYNEDLVGYGFDDYDFLVRCSYHSGFSVAQFCSRKTIPNSTEDRISNITSTSATLQDQADANKQFALSRIEAGHLVCKNHVSVDLHVLNGVSGATVPLNKD
jgi:hypothetical protein